MLCVCVCVCVCESIYTYHVCVRFLFLWMRHSDVISVGGCGYLGADAAHLQGLHRCGPTCGGVPEWVLHGSGVAPESPVPHIL